MGKLLAAVAVAVQVVPALMVLAPLVPRRGRTPAVAAVGPITLHLRKERLAWVVEMVVMASMTT